MLTFVPSQADSVVKIAPEIGAATATFVAAPNTPTARAKIRLKNASLMLKSLPPCMLQRLSPVGSFLKFCLGFHCLVYGYSLQHNKPRGGCGASEDQLYC